MVKIAGSDIPNLSKIVEDTFDQIGTVYGGRDLEFEDIDTDMDVDISDSFEGSAFTDASDTSVSE